MNINEIVAKVSANQFNWVRAKIIMQKSGEYTPENMRALAVAVETAERARRAADGYARTES